MGFSGIGPLSATAMIARLGELFMAERFEEIAEFWSFPCPMEIAGELTVMMDSEALAAFLAQRRELARLSGLTALSPRIIAVEMPRKHRFRVWFRWIYHKGDRQLEEEHTSVFYLIRKPWGGLSVEMMDIVRLPDAGAGRRSA